CVDQFGDILEATNVFRWRRRWGVAASADGHKLISVSDDPSGGNILGISYDSGVTWTNLHFNVGASFVDTLASSADATKLVGISRAYSSLGVTSMRIALSTNSGTNWFLATNSPLSAWCGVASSADGSKLAAVQVYGRIFVSSDSGTTWTATGPTNYWSGVAMSSDGSRLAAAVGNVFGPFQSGGIFISTNSGTSWVQTSAPIRHWISIASSADGTRL